MANYPVWAESEEACISQLGPKSMDLDECMSARYRALRKDTEKFHI
jgi:hypothetical protein